MELPQEVPPSGLRLRAPAERLSTAAANPAVDRIFSRNIDMGVATPGGSIVQLAESYHELYAQNAAARIDTLKTLYLELGRPSELIVSLYCSNFMPLFENWLASCELHRILVTHRLIAFTLDQQAHHRTLALGIKSCCLDPACYGDAGGSDQFGDRRFSRTMFYKNAVVRDVLELGANVLFQDVDMVWLADPFEYLANGSCGYDMRFMYDGPNPTHRPLYVNSGFFYARSNDTCKAIFDTALRNSASIFACGSHQAPFNRILAHFALHNVLSINVLPVRYFLNGHLFNLKRGLDEAAVNWRKEGVIVHCSWTANRQEKREKMEKFGLNYLPGKELDSSQVD